MHKNMVLIGLVLILIIPAFLHADKYTTMKDVIIEMAGYVAYLEDSLSQEIVHMQADIITEDGTTFTRTLHEGWTYGVTAYGDWRISDLDIIVYKDVDGEWVKIVDDEASDNHPTVTVTPSNTGTYLIELQVYEFDGDYSAAHYGMLIYHELH